MGISWREVLGLLVGLAICYATISYALSHTPNEEDRRVASELTQQEKSSSQQGGGTGQHTTSATASETETVVVRVTGASAEPFGVNYGNLDTSRTEEGVAPKDYQVRVRTDPGSGDYVSATAWKTNGGSKELKVQVLERGSVVKESTTKEEYGAASLRWRPGERPPPPGGTTTTPGVGKTGPQPRSSF